MIQPVITDPSYRQFLQRMDGLRSSGVLLGLDRMHLALERLNHPERRASFVQIAGTNGKGSTAAITEAIARAGGLKTALYTSPHLVRFTERIRLNGLEVEPHLLAPALTKVLATQVPLTYFEAATLVATCLIADAGVDLAVMETGLGGRLDAVTALPAVGTAITSISADHLDLLGPTLRDVAREKAAIARPGIPLLVPRLPPELAEEMASAARAIGAPLRVVDECPSGQPAAQTSALLGAHQNRNASLAVALPQIAFKHLDRPLSVEAQAEGLARVSWPGRLERLGQVLFDCAHNAEGAAALAAELAALVERPRVLVFSAVVGKDVAAMARLLCPHVESVIVTRCASDRALSPEALADHLPAGSTPGTLIPEPEAALAHALGLAKGGGLVIVAGSVFLVGQLRGLLLGEARDPVATSDPMPPR